jgi:TonB family protein
MQTVIRLFLFLLFFALTALFNVGLIDIRFEEIRYLLGTIASKGDMSNTFGVVAKYELIKRRMQYGEEQVNNYEFEAKMQALSSGSAAKPDNEDPGKKYYRIPVRLALNAIRYVLGKPIINPKEEDRIFSVLELAYFWERNRRYAEALKIYDEVLSTTQFNPELRAATLVHKAFCNSMQSKYDLAKKIYEQVINTYPSTEAGILAWKLLDFITSMEKERDNVMKARTSEIAKAKQFYLLMDFRNAIKNYSLTLSEKPDQQAEMEARFFKGRSHEELGETEDALMEYRAVIRRDVSKVWARQANRRMLMLGEFYEQQKSISDEAKRQLEAYQDQTFMTDVGKYTSMMSKNTLKAELDKGGSSATATSRTDDSILQFINQIGSLDLTGEQNAKRSETEKMQRELIESGTLGKNELRELKRRQELADNPFRRPTMLKQFIDDNSNELRYLYNKRLRTGVKLSGRMLMEIRIKADGSIGDAKIVQSNMGDAQFEESIVEQIKRWKFKAVPDSLGDITVNYPFEFFEEQ